MIFQQILSNRKKVFFLQICPKDHQTRFLSFLKHAGQFLIETFDMFFHVVTTTVF